MDVDGSIEGLFGAAANEIDELLTAEDTAGTLRERALSYFDGYVNYRRERTLRNYSGAVDLRRFDHLNWMSREDNVWFVAEHLCDVRHTPLLSPRMEKALPRIDARSMRAAMLGARR